MTHRWNAIDLRRIPACETADGNDRTERTCAHCGMVKITLHPPHGDAWREWRTADGKIWQGNATPPCLTRQHSPPGYSALDRRRQA